MCLALAAAAALGSSGKADRATPVDGKCADLEEPKLIQRVEPKYPEIVRRQGWEGKVELKAIVDTEGKVTNITVRSSPGKALSDLAIEAMSLWRYKPAFCKDLGKPVRVYVTYTTTFTLHRR
jgi:TonB family protein